MKFAKITNKIDALPKWFQCQKRTSGILRCTCQKVPSAQAFPNYLQGCQNMPIKQFFPNDLSGFQNSPSM